MADGTVGRPRLFKIGVPRPDLENRVNEIRMVAGAIRANKDVFGMPPHEALERVAASMEVSIKENSKPEERELEQVA